MKKVVFSLKSIALVAVASLGMVSCGGDEDPAPNPIPQPEPTPELTENFISVDDVQSATTETRWYMRVNGNTPTSPVAEYTLSETDSTKYAVYDLVTFGEGDKIFNVVYAVPVDESKATAAEGRYYYPYTSTTFQTRIVTAYFIDGDAEAEFGDDFKITPTALSYQDKTMTYTAEGTADANKIEVNYNGAANSMYIMDVSSSAKATKVSGSFNKSNATNVLFAK